MSNAPLPSSFDENTDFYDENRWQKLFRRLKEEPLIPFGCALTCWALYRASRSIRRSDHQTTNRMFRARIYAQAFTLVCIVAGSYYYAEDREKRKIFDGVKAEQRAREKNEKWIRELEARDREDREEKDARMKRMKGRLAKVEKEAKENTMDLSVGVAKSALERSEEKWKGSILEAVRELTRK